MYEEVYNHYMSEDNFGGLILECKKVRVPLNWNGSCWYLAVVDLKARQFQGGLSVGFGCNSPHNIRSYEFICQDWCPRQINSFDCGIYVMEVHGDY
ncbi:hypothetical protein ACH5RR_006173 [Cinchona calisaya]|uniref:Ubiquitin-like protease family profile domain-containing protein n=1 Tax=Cinchona calisaya TaxID=153742 RepID=A0ABD3AN87_9GENT